jgi:hypothetical protein
VDSRIEIALSRNERNQIAYPPASDLPIKKEVLNFLRSSFRKLGLDVAKFDSYVKQNNIQVRQQLANLKAEANAHAGSLLKVFFNGVDNAVGRMSSINERTFVQILGHADASNIHLNSIHAGSFPSDPNAATFVYGVGTDGFHTATDSVGFFFLWQNQNANTIIVDVDASLSLMGVCESNTVSTILAEADLKVASLTWWKLPMAVISGGDVIGLCHQIKNLIGRGDMQGLPAVNFA